MSPDPIGHVALVTIARDIERRIGQHCRRIADISEKIGTALKLSVGDLVDLRRGAYLHDIGKATIPDSILFKQGPLTNEEWEVMRNHTIVGHELCSLVPMLSTVLPIVRSHHERWDGSGYPDGLSGNGIPLLARIIQLPDIYDALTSDRPYKVAMSHEDAIRTIREEAVAGWRDPWLVQAFAQILGDEISSQKGKDR